MSPRVGFTARQRRWIIDRDSGECVRCGSRESLHVHHVVPQRWARTVLNWSEKQINAPHNGITLCAACHVGHPPEHYRCIHPDILAAKKLYWYDRESYKKAFGARDFLCMIQKPYWNTEYDTFFAELAARRTLTYARLSQELPPW